MKTTSTLFALALFAFCINANRAIAAESSAVPVAGNTASQFFEAKVVKVFAVKDGDAVSRAYVVAWKGQEVIVQDPLAKSHYAEGDTIAVHAMNLPYPQNKEPHRLLAFIVDESKG